MSLIPLTADFHEDMHACPSTHVTGAFVWEAMQEVVTLGNLSVLQWLTAHSSTYNYNYNYV